MLNIKPFIILGIALVAATVLKELTKQKTKRGRQKGAALAVAKRPLKSLGDLYDIEKRNPLTLFEQRMYYELRDGLPESIVLAQVAFSALVTTTSQQTRNRFDRKVADFVVCNRQLEPIAIIELDDPSHIGHEEQDAERDAMLFNAGYTTIRYKKIPTKEQLRSDLGAGLQEIKDSQKMSYETLKLARKGKIPVRWW